MIELSVIRDLVTIFGVIAGFSYYVLTVRTNQKNQQLALQAQKEATITRKIAIYNNYVDKMTNKEFTTSYLKLMYEQKWNTFEEWWTKYAPSDPDAYGDFLYVMLWIQNLGMLFEQEVIDIEMLYYDRGWGITRIWEHLQPIIQGYRDQMKVQNAFYHAEKLYNALKQYEQALNNK